jgi:hypothetical protein
MLEAIKIFILLFYFTFIYLIADSLLMALVTIPIFAYLELTRLEFKNIKKTLLILFLGFLAPALIYFYFSFLPGRWDPSTPLSRVILNSCLLGLFGAFLIGSRRWVDFLQTRFSHRGLSPRITEATSIAAIFLLMPLLIWTHSEYKVLQEKAFDKEAEIVLISLATAQNAGRVELKSYQKDLSALGFAGKSDHYSIYLDGESLPFEYGEVLNEETKPFVEKTAYRALLALKNPHSHTVKFFIGDEKGNVKQLKKQLPLTTH